MPLDQNTSFAVSPIKATVVHYRPSTRFGRGELGVKHLGVIITLPTDFFPRGAHPEPGQEVDVILNAYGRVVGAKFTPNDEVSEES